MFTILTLFFFLTKSLNLGGSSISGISSGGYAAVQMQIAYSGQFVGAAIFAGGPFYCAQNTLGMALTACTKDFNLIDINILNGLVQAWAIAGTVDPLSNLAGHRIYLFSGKNDFEVYLGVMKKLRSQYMYLGVSNITIHSQFDIDAGHCWPTLNYGIACNSSKPPFLCNCNYDGAGQALAQIYGKLRPRTQAIVPNLKSMSIAQFLPYGLSASTISMDTKFYYYMPTKCQVPEANCSIHMFLHGCKVSYSQVGYQFIMNAGFNEWAESNNIIIIYPQSVTSQVFPYNPQACWDWWGYTGFGYPVREGPQLLTFYNILQYFVQLA